MILNIFIYVWLSESVVSKGKMGFIKNSEVIQYYMFGCK